MKLSVILCAYNPRIDYLEQVLSSLLEQTLSKSLWELIIVDNNSNNHFAEKIDTSWHPAVKIIKEPSPGLINARITGTREAACPYIVTVDDDTILDINYLNNALNIFELFPEMGVFGGRSTGEFEIQPPDWIKDYQVILCVKDLGEQAIIDQINTGQKLVAYPENGPFLIAYRKVAFVKAFLPHYYANRTSKHLGRKGDSLSSGEDNDIVLSIYKKGYQTGYFPDLNFIHLIPIERLTKSYISKLVKASSRSWVQVLHLHGINPWSKIAPWTLPFRKAKAYMVCKAWASSVGYIRWSAACGIYEGQASIYKRQIK